MEKKYDVTALGELLIDFTENGTKERLAKRNQMIVSRFYLGETIAELGKAYYLSEKRIQGIIHEYESSGRKKDGGLTNE